MPATTDPRWVLHTNKSLFVVSEPKQSQTEPLEFLGISRDTGAAREGRETPEKLQQKLSGLGGSEGGWLQRRTCHAVLGCVCISNESFLLLVTEASVAVDVGGHAIYAVTQCEALPFSTSEPSREAAAAVDGVRQLFQSHCYFSHHIDITRRLQSRLSDVSQSSGRASDLFACADKRYTWNHQLVEPLQQQGVSTQWFTPLMQGFVQARTCPPLATKEATPLVLLLLARRGCRRAGTRYNARGVDDQGEVANWVETEQLALIRSSGGEDSWLSLALVRGSVPLFWDQPSPNAAVTLSRGPELVAGGFERHQRWVKAEYGDVLLVSLLSKSFAKRDTEGALIAALEQQRQFQTDLSMVHLDFHARVAGEEHSFDRELTELGGRLSSEIDRFGWLEVPRMSSAAGELTRSQTGVLRVNCFDCLDRTNTLQCQLAWEWLKRRCEERPALRYLTQAVSQSLDPGPVGNYFRGAFGDAHDQMFNSNVAEVMRPPLQEELRGMWADLGDALSEQYTGTASTSSAALRQGGNTALTLLEKGWRTLNRHYCAHFTDEFRQAALDLLLGKQIFSRLAPRSSKGKRSPVGRVATAIITWNLQGSRCWEKPGALRMAIRGACAPTPGVPPVDIVTFCFQEFMELTPENAVLQDSGDKVLQHAFESCAVQALQEALGEPFILVHSAGMVGLYIGVFVAFRLRDRVGNVAVDRIKKGLLGKVGNKGALLLRLEVAKTAIAFMSVHFESGRGKSAERAAQLRQVLSSSIGRAVQTAGGRATAAPVADHDLVVVAGDFNFRLNLPPNTDLDEAMRAKLANAWPHPSAGGGQDDPHCTGWGVKSVTDASAGGGFEAIFEHYDELTGSGACSESYDAMRSAGLEEGPVLFPATYKLLKGTAEVAYDKERTPAWCDRVLHSRVGVVRRRYCALGGLRDSDHRPVCAFLEACLLDVPQLEVSKQDDADLLGSGGISQPGSNSPQRSAASLAASRGHNADSMLTAHATTKKNPVATSEPAALTSPVSPVYPVSPVPPAAPSFDLLSFPENDGCSSFEGATSTTQAGGGVLTPGPLAVPGSLVPGQLVLAQFLERWYYANVVRVGAQTCDVAWLRPQANQWGKGEVMSHYLCSTGADETQHGDNLQIATQIRLTGTSSPLPNSTTQVEHGSLASLEASGAEAQSSVQASSNSTLDLLS